MSTAILSSGTRKKVASRVFGDSVDLDSSLCYTPSPGGSTKKLGQSKAMTDKAPLSNTITRIEEGENENATPEPTVLFQLADEANHQRDSLSNEQKENSVNQGKNKARRKSTVKVTATLESVRTAELNRLRATARSPIRQALAQQTAHVVNETTSTIRRSLLSSSTIGNLQVGPTKMSNPTSAKSASVNQSLNAIRTSKINMFQNKSKVVKSVRFQWEQENAEAKSLQDKVEESRRQIRAIQRQLSSAHFRETTKEDEAQKMEHFARLEQEYKFNSEVFREHQETLKEERQRIRRQSIEARAKIRQNNREGDEKMKMRKEEEDIAMFDVRADLHRARMEAKRANVEARRMSFQFRAGDARRIRGMRAVWREKELQERHRSFELSRAAAMDVENHKKQLAKKLRDDIQASNMDARKGRKRLEEQAHDAMIAEHASYELKWAGERDAEAYQKKMQEARRKSLAGRNKESMRHAKVMEELRCIAKEEETESFMLNWAGERDAKDYLAKLAEERRHSLQLRGKEARKAREYEAEEHAKAVQKAIADGILKSECQKDVEQYLAQCEDRRRKSLQFKGKQIHMNRLKEEERRLEQLQQDEINFRLDSLAQKDVEEYYKDCRRRRRKSLALRAKQKRQHAAWKKKREQEEAEDRAHTTYLNSLDIQHMALAKEQERARKAMDALRRAGYNFKGNPFSGVLKETP